MAGFLVAPYREEDKSGVTVAIAVLIRIEGPMVDRMDIERWVHEIDATLVPLLGADGDTPVGIAIRASERSGKRTAEDLILDAALALSNLAVEFRALREKLSVEATHGLAAAHEDLAAAVLNHRVGRIAREEAVEVAGIVGIHLSGHDSDGVGFHGMTPPQVRAAGTRAARR